MAQINWQEIAAQNGMSHREFMSELLLATIVISAEEIEQRGKGEAIRFTQGEYTLTVQKRVK